MIRLNEIPVVLFSLYHKGILKMFIYKIGLVFCFLPFIAQGVVADIDHIRKNLLKQCEQLKEQLIDAGYPKDIAEKTAHEILSQNIYEIENKNMLLNANNKEFIKRFSKNFKEFEMDVEHDIAIELVDKDFEHKNKLFDKRLNYQQRLDDKEADYKADKNAKKLETYLEEKEKAKLRAANKVMQGNKEKDRFGRTTPALGEVIDQALWKQVMPVVTNPYYLIKTGVIVGGFAGGTYFLAWYAPVILKEYIMKTFITPRPTILLPGSKIGRWDRLSRWKNGYKSPEMIFPTEVDEQLTDLVNITQMIKKDIKAGLKRTYRNVMLWGPPGTGKTLFANVLADRLDMDFCSITAGSLLQKDVGIQFLNEFEKMASKSKYGMMLFIDEADALFVDRNTLNIGTEQGLEHYKVLNHLLALTGDGSSKFMLVAATNHAQNIDEAMGRRFQERVYMPLPDEATRQELFNLYVKKLLYSEVENGAGFVKHAKKVVTPVLLQELVRQTKGLSGAEIKDIIAQSQNLGLQTENKQLTVDHVRKALKQGVQKRKDQDNDAAKRQEMAQNKGAVVQLTVCPTNGNNVDVQSSAPIVPVEMAT